MNEKRDELAVFRRMLDPNNWPVKKEDILIFDDEVYSFLPSGDPFEECLCRPLFWKFQ